jgi:hypothetical protein
MDEAVASESLVDQGLDVDADHSAYSLTVGALGMPADDGVLAEVLPLQYRPGGHDARARLHDG